MLRLPIIKKVLNSSIILVEGEGQKDAIIMSKGIGYGRKAGEEVALTEDSRFFLPVSSMEAKQIVELLDTIPSAYLELTKEIVEYAKAYLETELNEHVYVALADHIHFAIRRFNDKMITKNKIFWEIKNFYPKEFQVGIYALKLIKDRLNVSLPEEEAANVAFHIVNAQHSSDCQADMFKAARLIGNIINVIIYSLRVEPQEDSIHYTRFKTHIQFFVNRVLNVEMISSEDDFMYKQVESAYPEALVYAEKVRTYMLREYQVAVTNEEIAYLTVHIARLMQKR